MYKLFLQQLLKLFFCNLKEFVVVIYAPFEEKYFSCGSVPVLSFSAV